MRWDDLAPALPLLIELLKSEARVEIAFARERSARDAAVHATNLAKALDGARKDVSTASLRLQQLNATLEHRVVEEVARRTQAEAALHQAQKLEAISALA